MNTNRTVCCCLLIATFATTLSGCATIVSGGKNQVTVDNSGGATYFSVYDSKNRIVDSGVTPKQLTLKTTETWFKPAKYHVAYAGQEGVTEYDLNAGFNWWTAGNILIGGVPGIAVDAATGAAWRLQSQVIGQIPTQQVVVNPGQGSEMVAAHLGINSTNGIADSNAAPQNRVRPASYEGRSSATAEDPASPRQQQQERR